jgi:predicted GNAT family acetyltransferase
MQKIMVVIVLVVFGWTPIAIAGKKGTHQRMLSKQNTSSPHVAPDDVLGKAPRTDNWFLEREKRQEENQRLAVERIIAEKLNRGRPKTFHERIVSRMRRGNYLFGSRTCHQMMHDRRMMYREELQTSVPKAETQLQVMPTKAEPIDRFAHYREERAYQFRLDQDRRQREVYYKAHGTTEEGRKIEAEIEEERERALLVFLKDQKEMFDPADTSHETREQRLLRVKKELMTRDLLAKIFPPGAVRDFEDREEWENFIREEELELGKEKSDQIAQSVKNMMLFREE